MNNKNILNESLSKNVYHFTTLGALKSIIYKNTIKCSHVDPKSADDSLNKGYIFYLSLTRNFNSTIGYVGNLNADKETFKFNVRIELDGEKLNNKYKGEPVEWMSIKKRLEDESDCHKKYGRKLVKNILNSGISYKYLDLACKFYMEKNIPIEKLIELFKDWHFYVERFMNIDLKKLNYDKFIDILSNAKKSKKEINEGKKETDDSFFNNLISKKYSPPKFSQEYFSMYSETEDRLFSNTHLIPRVSNYIKNIDILINKKQFCEIVETLKAITSYTNFKFYKDKISIFTSLNDFNDFSRRNKIGIKEFINYAESLINNAETVDTSYYLLSKTKGVKNGSSCILDNNLYVYENGVWNNYGNVSSDESKNENKYEKENSLTETNLDIISKIAYVICYPSNNIEDAIRKKMKASGLDTEIYVYTLYNGNEKVELKRGRPSKKLEKRYEKVNLIDYVISRVKEPSFLNDLTFSQVRGLYNKVCKGNGYLQPSMGHIQEGLIDMMIVWTVKYKKAVDKKCNKVFEDLNKLLLSNDKNYDKILTDINLKLGKDFVKFIFDKLMINFNLNFDAKKAIELIKKSIPRIKSDYKIKKYNYDELFIFQSKLRSEILNAETKKGEDAQLANFFNGNKRHMQAQDYMSSISENNIFSKKDVAFMVNECIKKLAAL